MSESRRRLYAFYGKPSSNPIKIAIVLEELGLNYEIASLSVSRLYILADPQLTSAEGAQRTTQSFPYCSPP